VNPTFEISIRDVQIELARRVFYNYLRLKDPEFYDDNKPHLKELADLLQKFADNKLTAPSGKIAKILILNLPPRTGKSYTLTNLCAWLLGRGKHDPDRRPEKIITVSYNDELATDFSRFCRDNINTERADADDIIFQDVFTGVTLKKGDSAAKKWALEGEYFSYLGTGFKGQLTGKGATYGIIDDPVKNAEEAYNEKTLDYIWNFYRNTFRSRVENNGKQIINHTRWRDEDLAGRIMDLYGDDVYVYKKSIMENEVTERQAIRTPDGTVIRYDNVTVGGDLLCEDICNMENFLDLQKTIGPEVFRANYFQEPLDLTGKMYQNFMTYEDLPLKEAPIHCYVDTADTGDDYLCAIVYEVHGKQAYILDVIYTKDAMELTEPELADMLDFNLVNYCKIESNNGGRGFARAVEKILLQEYDTNTCVMDWFHQSKNKDSRILTASHWVQKNIFFPHNWNHRFPEYFKAMTRYTKEGKNSHDDGPDATTGVAEQFAPQGGMPMFNMTKQKLREIQCHT